MINATDVLHLTAGTLLRLILCGIYSASNANGFNGKQASAGPLTGVENEAAKTFHGKQTTGADKIS